jgi:myo-inositol 2-dehydrogenase/D-chiro-inositol 1-dehydrogenase
MNNVEGFRLRVGVIGAGRIGSLRAEVLAHHVPQAELVAVSDADLSAATRLAARISGLAVRDDYHALIVDPGIDALFVCTPTSTHAEIMVAAAAAGKHLFVEKPIALDMDQVDYALVAVERAGILMQIGLNRRFDPTFSRVRQAIVDGTIGEVHLLHIISRDPAPPPLAYVVTSGGLFADMMIHDFDMARYLVGSEVVSVYARGAVRISPEIGEAGDIDTATVMLTFDNGVLGTIENSRQAVYGYDQRVELLGSLGGISTGNVYPNQVTISTADDIHRDLPLNFFMQRYAESYTIETRAFVDAVLTGQAPSPTGTDGRAALQIAMAARESLMTGQPVALTTS